MKKIVVGMTCVAMLTVVSCAEKQVDLDPKFMSNVHRITLVGPPEPTPIAIVTQDQVNAQRAVTAAAAIPFAGVLGAAIAGGVAGAISAQIARETSKPLNDAVTAERYSYAAALRDALVTNLKTSGFDVSTVAPQPKGAGVSEKIEGGPGQPDLTIDAVATATCTNVGAGTQTHFRPVVSVLVKLTRPGEANPIMNKTFVYDDEVATADAFQIKGDPQYDIPDYAALKANINGCLAGIKASAIPLASAVARVIAVQKTTLAVR